jgi:signal transduction histidine kinase
MPENTPSEHTEPLAEARISIRTATRLAWSLWAACVVLTALTLPLVFVARHLAQDFPFLPGERWALGTTALMGLLSLAYPTVGALIASRLPSNPIGWIFCGMGLLYTTARLTEVYADYALLENFALPGGEYVAWFSTWVGWPGHLLGVVFLMLLFPGGRLPSGRWRVVAWAAVLGAAATALARALTPGPLATHFYVDNPFEVMGVIGGGFTTYDLFPRASLLGMMLLLVSSLAALLSLVLRLHRARGDERQQFKWFLYAAVLAAGGFSTILVHEMVVTYTTNLLFDRTYMMSWPVYRDILFVAVFATLVLPVFTYIAILRYHLYDIDLIINRTLVYGALSACVVSIYVLAVGGLSALFQSQGNLGISLVATGIVAILFQPLRSRLQRGVNRMMYGERDDPYAAISRLGRRLEATLAPEAVLPTVVETIAQALKLPYAAILLKEDGGYRSAASYGSLVGEPETLLLVYQREEIGRLVLSPRAPGERFSGADRRLLADLARQAEVAVHAVRLTADLQRSRERLVATREEERRRLRRDLHDGLGPTLASLALRLDAARKMVRPKPEDAEQLLFHLKDQTQDTVADVRRLVYGLRPPALDDLGLVGAIRQQAESHDFFVGSFHGATGKEASGGEAGSVALSIEIPERLPPLAAAVEVACYRVVQEALTNVARHAHAKSCHLRLSVQGDAEGVLELEVSDDGVGMPKGRRAGVGMSSMRERAEELGGTCEVEPGREGGTRVLARLPLPTSEEKQPARKKAISSWRVRSASS